MIVIERMKLPSEEKEQMKESRHAWFYVVCLCLFGVISLQADLEWGYGGKSLTAWTFANYREVRMTEEEISGETLCEYAVLSPFLYSPAFEWKASDQDMLAIELGCSNGGYGELLFKHAPEIAFRDELKIKFVTPGGDAAQRQMLFIPLKHPDWKGRITNFRLAFRFQPGVKICVYRIQLYRQRNQPGNLLANSSFEMPGVAGSIWKWCLKGEVKGVPLIEQDAENGNTLKVAGGKTWELVADPAYLDFLDEDTAQVKVSFRAAGEKPGKWKALLLMQDALGNEVDRQSQQWKGLAGYKMMPYEMEWRTVPLATARICFSLIWDGDEPGNFMLADVSMVQRQKTPLEDWTGEWIRPGDRPDEPPRKMFFRTAFAVPSDLRKAWLAINSDDQVIGIYINGVQLPKLVNADSYNVPDAIHVDSYLTPGRNVLAVQAYNFNVLGGLIADLTLIMPDRRQTIGTCAAWRSCSNEQEGWYKTDFDDRAWAGSVAMGRGKATPFGVLERPRIQETGKLELHNLEIIPCEEKPFAIAVKVDYSIVQEGDIEMAFYLAGNPILPPRGFKLATVKVEPESKQWYGKLPYPDFLPSGQLELRVDAPGLERQAARRALTVPDFDRPNCSASLRINDHFSGEMNWNGLSLPLLHHWCGSDGQMTEELMGLCRENKIPFYVGNHYSAWGWRPDGQHDFTVMDHYAYRMLEVDPNAKFTLQIAADNYHNWELRTWLEAHPSECARREDGGTVLKQIHSASNVKVVSHASKPWREELRRSLAALARHLKQSPYGHRALCIQPISGMGGEWYMWGTFDTGGGTERLDYSQPFQEYFADFALQKYGTLDAVNQAWRTDYSSTAEISIPSVAERDRNDWFEFLDARTSRRTIDFRQAVSELMADNVIAMCDAIKSGSGERMYAGSFYGYTTYVTDPMPTRSEGGHFALGRVLRSPRVDYLTHLLRYADRMAGEPAGFMTPESSLLLHGKVPFVQADIRTHRLAADSPDAQYGRLRNLQDGIAVIRRDFSNALVNGVGYEFGYYGNGWIAADRRLMQVVGRCREIEAEVQASDTRRLDTENSIAVIVDDIVTYFSAQCSPLHNISMKYQMPEFYKTGCGMDTYLLEDLELMPEYRCYVFLNAYRITPEQENWINAHLKRGGKVLAFVYAAGCVGESGINPERVQDITGIKTEVREKQCPARITYVENTAKVGKYLPVGGSFGSGVHLGPVFIPQAGQVLAKLEGEDTPAVVVKDFGDQTVCYSSIPGLSAELLRGLAECAEIPIINASWTDATYVGDNLFAVHTGAGGKRVFRVPKKYQAGNATELFTGKKYPIRDGKFTMCLEPVSTVLFRLSE